MSKRVVWFKYLLTVELVISSAVSVMTDFDVRLRLQLSQQNRVSSDFPLMLAFLIITYTPVWLCMIAFWLNRSWALSWLFGSLFPLLFLHFLFPIGYYIWIFVAIAMLIVLAIVQFTGIGWRKFWHSFMYESPFKPL
ncbi:MAG: hypothetical protein ABI690_33560 [Chloroflexota bacterium]